MIGGAVWNYWYTVIRFPDLFRPLLGDAFTPETVTRGVLARFPVGSPEAALVAELDREGFATERGDYPATYWRDRPTDERKHGRCRGVIPGELCLLWSTDSDGKIQAIGVTVQVF